MFINLFYFFFFANIEWKKYKTRAAVTFLQDTHISYIFTRHTQQLHLYKTVTAVCVL